MSDSPANKPQKAREKHPLIIEEPDSLRLPHKITAVTLTLLFWGILLYLWQPLISMVAWALNIKLFYNHMIVLGGYHNFLALVIDYLIVISIMGGVLIVWARVNLWRFRGKDRRKRPDDASPEELAQFFNVSAEQLQQWQTMNSLEVSLNDEELPSKVVAHIPKAGSDDNKTVENKTVDNKSVDNEPEED